MSSEKPVEFILDHHSISCAIDEAHALWDVEPPNEVETDEDEDQAGIRNAAPTPTQAGIRNSAPTHKQAFVVAQPGGSWKAKKQARRANLNARQARKKYQKLANNHVKAAQNAVMVESATSTDIIVRSANGRQPQGKGLSVDLIDTSSYTHIDDINKHVTVYSTMPDGRKYVLALRIPYKNKDGT
ncbi:hypothetical protein HDU86_007363 [Geranomyces michiganensis]|nr:hypothetical protein HDU86_007363 [Geranomyces michiganensis]